MSSACKRDYVANDSCLFARNELTTSNASHSGSGWFARVELMQCTMYTSLINTNMATTIAAAAAAAAAGPTIHHASGYCCIFRIYSHFHRFYNMHFAYFKRK